MALSALQEKFIEEYIKCRNGAKAARRAGYAPNSAKVQASRLLTNANLLKEIEDRTKENAMGLEEAVSRLSDIGRADLGDWVDDDGAVNIARMKADGATFMIRKVKRTERSGVSDKGAEWREVTAEVELHDAKDAQKFIVDLHKRSASGKEDDPIHVKHVVKGYVNVDPSKWPQNPDNG